MGPVVWWTLGVAFVALCLYGLHRFALWLEEKGHLYYLKKKPEGGGASLFSPLQRAIEPQIEHVLIVKERAQHAYDADGGPKDPSLNDAAQKLSGPDLS